MRIKLIKNCRILILTACCGIVGCDEDNTSSQSEADSSTTSPEMAVLREAQVNPAVDIVASPEPSDPLRTQVDREDNQELPESPVVAAVQLDVPFTEILLHHLLDQEETVVIRGQSDWIAYLGRARPFSFQIGEDPNDPHCDFRTHMLVAHSFEPHDGCPWSYQGVDGVTNIGDTIVVKANIDSRFIPLPNTLNINDCHVVNVHEGFAVCIPQSDLPVEVMINWY